MIPFHLLIIDSKILLLNATEVGSIGLLPEHVLASIVFVKSGGDQILVQPELEHVGGSVEVNTTSTFLDSLLGFWVSSGVGIRFLGGCSFFAFLNDGDSGIVLVCFCWSVSRLLLSCDYFQG